MTGISTWLLWPVVYLFGSLIKVCAVTVGIFLAQAYHSIDTSVPQRSPSQSKVYHGVGKTIIKSLASRYFFSWSGWKPYGL